MMIILGALALAAGLSAIYLFWFVGRRDSKLPPGEYYILIAHTLIC